MDNRDSILISIKKLLGLSETYKVFDTDIIIHINSVIFSLSQLGIGKKNYRVIDDTNKWNEFIGDDNIEAVKNYIFLKVKMIFDPPTGSSVLKAYEEQIKELEFRLNLHYEVDKDRVIHYE